MSLALLSTYAHSAVFFPYFHKRIIVFLKEVNTNDITERCSMAKTIILSCVLPFHFSLLKF